MRIDNNYEQPWSCRIHLYGQSSVATHALLTLVRLSRQLCLRGFVGISRVQTLQQRGRHVDLAISDKTTISNTIPRCMGSIKRATQNTIQPTLKKSCGEIFIVRGLAACGASAGQVTGARTRAPIGPAQATVQLARVRGCALGVSGAAHAGSSSDAWDGAPAADPRRRHGSDQPRPHTSSGSGCSSGSDSRRGGRGQPPRSVGGGGRDGARDLRTQQRFRWAGGAPQVRREATRAFGVRAVARAA